MSRLPLVALVLAVDTGIMAMLHPGWMPVVTYGVVTALVLVLGRRAPLAAFLIALGLTALTGQSYALLLWTSYQAGNAVETAPGIAMMAGGVAGSLATRLAAHATNPRYALSLATLYVVFVALPLLTGRYLAQHRRLVTALEQRNRRLRREHELLADRERLRERLRIARDMHDSLGHRLSLVSVQATAMEVTAPDADDVRQLARSARLALDELHELVGALRTADEAEQGPGVEAVDTLIAEFRTAGSTVTLSRGGTPASLAPEASQAAYRVVQEALTNAARHAPGAPVHVAMAWETDALLLTITNALAAHSSVPGPGGHGLAGLGERVSAAAGFLDHRHDAHEFRVVAMLPTETADSAEAADSTDIAVSVEEDTLGTGGGARVTVLALVTATLMFAVLPVSLLFGTA